MKRALALFLWLLLALSPLAGCGRMDEANKLSIAAGIAIDRAEDGYAVVIEVIHPSQKDQSVDSVLVSTRGQTIYTGMWESPSLTGQRLFFTHANVAVIGQQAARQGLSELIGLFVRQKEVALTIRPVVSAGEAADIFSADPLMASIKSVELADILKASSRLGQTPDIPFYQFAGRVLEPGVDGFLPFVRLAQSGETETPEITGAALFSGDKLACVIDESLTQCLLWSTGTRTGGSFSSEGVAVEVWDVRAGITADADGAVIRFALSVSAAEGQAGHGAAVRLAEDALRRGMETLLALTRTHKSDVLGIGRAIRRGSLAQWKTLEDNWYGHYAEYPVTLEIEARYVERGRAG